MSDFIRYINLTRSTDANDQPELWQLRTQLERRAPAITQRLLQIIGDAQITIAGNASSRQTLISNSLLVNRDWAAFATPAIDHHARMVENTINNAIGTIDADLWPHVSVDPELAVHDQVLADRCAPLLTQGANGDTIIREATTVLEDRIRETVGHDRLATAIPRAADQGGERLVNKVFSVGEPMLRVDRDPGKRDAFRKMLVGVFAYPRNESHHHLSDEESRSWVWSVVGLVDQLIEEIKSAEVVE